MDDGSDEYPFRFIDGPVSLVTLASTELSLALWRHKLSTSGKIETVSRRSYQFTSILRSFKCTEYISDPLPSRIEGLIDKKIDSMETDLVHWVKLFAKSSSDIRNAFSTTFDDVVCDPNGKISHGKTAAKALKNDSIDNKAKFKIACMFCLEDEIKRIWPLVSTDVRFVDTHRLNTSMPFNYWGCMMTSSRDFEPIENRVLNAYRRRNWTALRYFWQDLNDEARVRRALEFFGTNDIDAMICILPKLKKNEAQKVFEAKACEILSILLSNHEYVEHVLALWTQMENVISKEVFLQLIEGLWKLTWNIDRNDNMRRYKVDGLLMTIWDSSPDQFKSHVLSQHSAKFFNELKSSSPRFVENYGHDMEFLLEVMRKNTFEFRNSIWKQNWRKIVLRTKPSYLKQFVELCLPEDETTDAFKSGPMLEYKLMYTSLIRYGFYSDMAEYMKFCSSNDLLDHEMAKNILKNNTGVIISTLLDCKNFENFENFVGVLFSDTNSASKFKQDLFWSAKSLKSLFVMLNRDWLNDFQRIFSRFSTSDGNLDEMKTEFLKHLPGYLTTAKARQFDVSKWNELLKWCTKNESDIEIFKRSLDINVIFETCFDSYAFKSFEKEYLQNWGRLFFYDNFTEWYFADEKVKRDFRMDKIINYKNSKAIRKFYQQAPRDAIYRMLLWAFNKDLQAIMRYQQTLVEDGVLGSVIPANTLGSRFV